MRDETLKKYKLVIDEWFVNGFNGAAAYRSFYPSSVRADDSFSKIQSIPEVQLYIQEKFDLSKKRLQVTHEGVLEELYNWAYSDITQTISLSPTGVESLPVEIRRLITKYKKTVRKVNEKMTEEVIELHFVSKEKAMDMIAKHIGFYEKDNYQRNPEMSRIEKQKRIAELKEKLKES